MKIVVKYAWDVEYAYDLEALPFIVKGVRVTGTPNANFAPIAEDKEYQVFVVSDTKILTTQEEINEDYKKQAEQHRDWWLSECTKTRKQESELKELQAKLSVYEAQCPHGKDKEVTDGREVED